MKYLDNCRCEFIRTVRINPHLLSDREACLAAGMNDHLGKPIKPKELWSKLLYWIKPRAVD